VSAAPVEDDSSFELKLRPQRLNEFIGQTKVKGQLAVAIEAARSRGEGHGSRAALRPRGLGKTTLANSSPMNSGCIFSRRPLHAADQGDLTAIITNMQDKQVLFIDEIHRLQPCSRNALFALEDYSRHHYGQGPRRTHTLEVKPFTSWAATSQRTARAEINPCPVDAPPRT